METSLRTLFPKPKELTILGEVLSLSELVAEQIPDALEYAEQADLRWRGDHIDLLHSLSGTRGVAFYNLLALLSGQPVEWIKKISISDTLKLSVAVFEVNQDFFGLVLGLPPGQVPAQETR